MKQKIKALINKDPGSRRHCRRRSRGPAEAAKKAVMSVSHQRTAAISRVDASGAHLSLVHLYLSLHSLKPLQLLPPLQPEIIHVCHVCEDLLIPLSSLDQLLSLFVKTAGE